MIAFSLSELEALLKPSRIVGQSSQKISRIANLSEAEAGDTSFLSNPKYRSEVASCRASLILVPEDYAGQPQDNQVFFHCPSPSRSLGILCKHIEQLQQKPALAGIHPTAIVAESASIDPSASIGPYVIIGENSIIEAHVEIQSHVVIGRHCHIQENTKLWAHVTILNHSQIGKRVIIHSGTVIGSDGFGYETNAEEHHEKLSHIGCVIIEDDVEIGANCCVDRARFATTLIGSGTKIDNLVQIGHNVRIGAHCILVSQVGIAGSTIIEDHVTLGGQVGIAGHIRIGRGSMVGAQSGIAKNIPPKSFLRGTPAMEYGKANRFYTVREKLPSLLKRVRELEGQIKRDGNELHVHPEP
ncbi:MAG: UDP-3-O-(3-hydroxymyristoyl)glucosamine N-acyltransferase [Puniceicoccales bacterium]|jgi:UDP-3-O-[3-hydroxymyristoyl] glucosamine N-acyltransferase|nr:UDP-3-O-(3-hydroxymyristoyl)glucosamine N-acyltransferase [Puniceicoccales bacterium]